MRRIVYRLAGFEDEVNFLDLEAAEKFSFDNCPEYFTCKDSYMDFCADNIYEDRIIFCEGCDEEILEADMVGDCEWIKPSCCDTWFHSKDCHN